MPKRDIIVIGGSAGASAVLHRVVAGLPADLPAAVFVVTHAPADGPMLLAGLLDASSKLPVAYAADGDAIVPGRISVGPPDRHLLLTREGVRLGRGPRENLSRPAIDALFRSAAAAFGSRTIGVILSGMLNDGAAGLSAIKQCGGETVVQDPLDAFAPDMPRAALQAVDVDHVTDAASLAALLASLAREEAPLGRASPPEMQLEVAIAMGERLGVERLLTVATPSPFSCPECDGVLSEMRGGGPLRFRCQIGHAVTGEVLEDSQALELERAMGIALRVLEERIALIKRLAADARTRGKPRAAELHEARVRDYIGQAEVLRQALLATLSQRMPSEDRVCVHDEGAKLT